MADTRRKSLSIPKLNKSRRPSKVGLAISKSPRGTWGPGDMDARPTVSIAARLDEDPVETVLSALSPPPNMRADNQIQEILRWWQKYIPASGAEIATELRAPDSVLLEILRRGKVFACEAEDVMIEEGDDVKFYTIVLMGRCKLRCGKPKQPGSGNAGDDDAVDLELVASRALDADGFIPLLEIQCGESLGMVPGERSSYKVTCLQPTVTVLLNRDDYDASLRAFHKELHSLASSFFQLHRICPEASANNLERLVRSFRQIKIAKGKTVMRAGDPHRYFWILKSGACSVLMDSQAGTAELAKDELAQEANEEEADMDDCDEEGDHGVSPSKLAQLRASRFGADLQRRAAAQDDANKMISKLARGRLRKALEGPCFSTTSPVLQRRVTAKLNEPGTMFGEEALHLLRDAVAAKYTYTVRADQESFFFVADFSTWKQLAIYFGSQAVARITLEQLQRRCNTALRANIVHKRLAQRKHDMQRREINKVDWQGVRLPQSAGYSGPSVVEDMDEMMNVISDHRRFPPNAQDLPSLFVLEGTDLGPRSPKNGPAVKKILKYVSENAAASDMASITNFCDMSFAKSRRVKTPSRSNPMGECVSAFGAKYQAIPREMLRTPPQGEFPRSHSQPAGIGICLHTEANTETALMKNSSLPSLPKVARVLTGEGTTGRPTSQSSQNLFPCSTFCAFETEGSAGLTGSLYISTGTPTSAAEASIENDAVDSPRKKQANNEWTTKVKDAFLRSVRGKSVLALVEKPKVQKSTMRSLMSAELQLCFVKKAADMWHRLQSPTETFHALIWDLPSSDVSVNVLLQQIRQHQRYDRLPIIVLSTERELSDVVRTACSYVVFHPIAAPMLREALLWCFDCRLLVETSKDQLSAVTEPESKSSGLKQFLVSSTTSAGNTASEETPSGFFRA